MNLLSGSIAVKSIYAGSQKVWNVYQGSTQIWALHKVTFEDWDGTNLKYQEVVNGNPETPPPDPTRAGYQFSGWEAVPSDGIDEDWNVVSDVSVYATYQEDVTEDPPEPFLSNSLVPPE